MALFLKQDFSPPVLSRRWIAIKFRPNMLLYSREHIISILESGLLFREDSIEVEQGAPSPEDVWKCANGGKLGWMTGGERMMCLAAFAACVTAFPPTDLSRSSLLRVAGSACVPLTLRALHRRKCSGSGLGELLSHMREYLALARRAAACLKECAALHAHIGSLSTVIESTHTLLCRQQSELAVLLSRASSALLGNAPWLRADVAWDAIQRDSTDNLMKIHHAFLVVQSTLLKHIAMAHFVPTSRNVIYKNHNERIYWIHTVLINYLSKEFDQNYEALDRMYRLLKNYGAKDLNVQKKPGTAVTDSWLYSDVHSGIARTSLELKLALNKCTSLDMFLDSCATNKQEIDLDVLNKDIDCVINDITDCLQTIQNSQIRLKKLKSKFTGNTKKESVLDETEMCEEDEVEIYKIEDKEPETKDEVFYLFKTDDDDNITQPVSDVTTGPGKKERETTKVVLTELKRKLVSREDVMRERERQALVKTMPELKDNVPEFPRQIIVEEVVQRKGYINKIKNSHLFRNKLLRFHKICRLKKSKRSRYKLILGKYDNESNIKDAVLEANASLSFKKRLLTIFCVNKMIYITIWFKNEDDRENVEIGEISAGWSDVEASCSNKTVNETTNTHRKKQNGTMNHKFSKRELELTSSSSENDFEFHKEQLALLKDIRRHRVARKKNYPVKRGSIEVCADESLRPVEYSFGTGMAIASVLQVNNNPILKIAQEEVFTGEGEVSNDSGNDEDA